MGRDSKVTLCVCVRASVCLRVEAHADVCVHPHIKERKIGCGVIPLCLVFELRFSNVIGFWINTHLIDIT